MQNFLKTKNLGNIKVLVCSAVFAAISIICGKFLAISIGDTIRISFENTPIILSGFCFGPVVGLLTGLIADIVNAAHAFCLGSDLDGGSTGTDFPTTSFAITDVKVYASALNYKQAESAYNAAVEAFKN